MIHRELAAVTILIIGVAAFYGSRQLDKDLSTVPKSPETATGTTHVVVPPATNRTAKNRTSNVVATPKAAPAIVQKPAQTAPVKEAPKPAPVKPAPVVVKATPKAAPRPPPAKPLPTAAPAVNPDDSPGRKKSGKVKASTNPNMPPSFGPLNAKVHVIVYSDFQ